MTNFNYKPANIPQAVKIETETERYYLTPEGHRFNSVTQVIGAMMPKQEIIEWRERVGDAEADKVVNIAVARGKAVHRTIEQYLLGEQFPKKIMPATLATFQQMKKQIDQSLTTIYGIELPLFSYNLKLAGTCDLLGEWNYIPSIIDHKTSKYEKRAEDIQGYFLQACMYSMMYEELSGQRLEQLVVLIGCDDSPEAQVFIRQRKDYEEETRAIIEEFHKCLA